MRHPVYMLFERVLEGGGGGGGRFHHLDTTARKLRYFSFQRTREEREIEGMGK